MQVFPSIYRIAWGTRDYVHTHSCEYITGVCPPAISAKDTAQQHTYGREDHETGTRDTRDQRARALTRRPRTGQQLRQGAPAGLQSAGTVATSPVADPPPGNRATTERIRYDAATRCVPPLPSTAGQHTAATTPNVRGGCVWRGGRDDYIPRIRNTVYVTRIYEHTSVHQDLLYRI